MLDDDYNKKQERHLSSSSPRYSILSLIETFIEQYFILEKHSWELVFLLLSWHLSQ